MDNLVNTNVDHEKIINRCGICNNNENNITFTVREMMYGYAETFLYFQCQKCGCLQILDIPEDMSKYYPTDYYEFTEGYGITNPIKRIFKKCRDNYAVSNCGVLGKSLYTSYPDEKLKSLSWIPLCKSSSILDIGCGIGVLLNSLRGIGFRNLCGIDPYIPDKYVKDSDGFKIIKKTIYDLSSRWDLIMFHHCFEHLVDPVQILIKVHELLAEDGICMIRIPTVSSYAWEHYKTNWVQLDAPRHFFLHSVNSMKIIAEKANLEVVKIIYDSSDFQFWGSEQYIKGIPLKSEHSYLMDKKKSFFSSRSIKEFKQQSIVLNSENKGDQAIFYLKKYA